MPPKKSFSSSAAAAAKSKSGGRQSTLGSFFALPPSTKPPVKQQTKLKKEPQQAPLSSSEDEPDADVDAMKVDVVEKAVATDDAGKEKENEDANDGDAVMTGTNEAEDAPSEATAKEPAKAKKEPSSPKASKKRMRSSPEPMALDTPEELAASVSEDEPVLKRGRKSKPKPAAKEEPMPVSEDEPTKKKGGRPKGSKGKPKSPVKEEPTSASEDEPMKEKGGRPKGSKGKPKSPVKEEPTSASEDEPMKEKRGRPKGSKGKPKSPVKEEPTSASEDEPMKEKRGRPKEGHNKPKAIEKEPTPASKDEPVKERRGRPKGSQNKPKSAVKEEPATASDNEPMATLDIKGEPTSASEEEPVAKPGRAKGKTPKKSAKEAKEATTEKATVEKKPRKPRKKAVDDEAESESAASGTSDAEAAAEKDVSDDDRKKPEIGIKARKEVQSKLVSKSEKPAYPDWEAGAPVPYAALVKTFTLVESTTKRLEKLKYTSQFLRQVLRLTPDELLLVVHLMINKLAADYEGIELGIGESLLMKAIGQSCGRSLAMIKADQKEIGDLGEVALKSRNNQRTLLAPKPLTVKSVHEGLKNIALTKGDNAQGRKVANIMKLLSAAKGEEAKYLVRGLEGKLRLGSTDRTVIVSLSQAMVVHELEQQGKPASVQQMTDAEEILKTVYSELPNYDIIVPSMLKDGIMRLRETCKMQPGVPLKPMLAKPTKAISEVLDRFENKRFTCEYKYDGERVQIHYVSGSSPVHFPTIDPTKGISKIFSRNSEDLSAKYPDILDALPQWVAPGIDSFVLDCEAVAWDRDEKRVLPFQQLMTRKRKDVALADVKVKVCVFAFDLLFLNGASLVQQPLAARREQLHRTFLPQTGEFAFATYTDGQELETIQTFLDESVKASCEGLMVKMLDGDESGYEPSKRSRNWLKVKKDYLASSAADSLDLVVIGAFHGRGKRTAVYGAFLLACYDPRTQEFQTVCGIGTGFSEDALASLHSRLLPLEIDRPKPYYTHAGAGAQQPDVWFDAKVVWEVKCADLSLSPKYKAAAAEMGGKGVSLRFPRFVRERDDKKAEDATSAGQVADMYRKQEVVMSAAAGKKGNVDDDFEY